MQARLPLIFQAIHWYKRTRNMTILPTLWEYSLLNTAVDVTCLAFRGIFWLLSPQQWSCRALAFAHGANASQYLRLRRSRGRRLIGICAPANKSCAYYRQDLPTESVGHARCFPALKPALHSAMNKTLPNICIVQTLLCSTISFVSALWNLHYRLTTNTPRRKFQ